MYSIKPGAKYKLKPGEVFVEVIGGVEGNSLYICNDDSGYRLSGRKPWGGGECIHKFVLNIDDLKKQLEHYDNRR